MFLGGRGVSSQPESESRKPGSVPRKQSREMRITKGFMHAQVLELETLKSKPETLQVYLAHKKQPPPPETTTGA